MVKVCEFVLGGSKQFFLKYYIYIYITYRHHCPSIIKLNYIHPFFGSTHPVHPLNK